LRDEHKIKMKSANYKLLITC